MIAAVFAQAASRGLAVIFCVALAAPVVARDLPDFAGLAERQGAAVVNISTTQAVRQVRPGVPSLEEDDPMFDFFRRFVPRHPGAPRGSEPDNRSLGSGFIVSADGHILTNAHVVDGADEIVVKLTDKREFRARVMGTDARTDLALLKIEAAGLPRVSLGDPSKLRVGDWVVAIGSPFGFENSVTAGIVSAKGRSLPQENFVPFIQTDVAINPGNSGGPLFNMKGEVVGINSQIYSRTGGFMGLSFAIPIDVAMNVQEQLRVAGRVQRGRVGVVIQEVSRDLADSFRLGRPVGALVSSVEKGSPADKAGFEQGDIVLSFDGRAVEVSTDLPRLVGGTRPGSKVPVQVWRRGAARNLTVLVAELPEEKPRKVATRLPKPELVSPNKLGIAVAEPNAEQRRDGRFAAGGVVVEALRSASARASEIQAGDGILALVSKGVRIETRSVEQFNRAVASLDAGQAVTLLIARGDVQTFVPVRSLER
ncbi:MAG: DegQ family serine endoprotease [Zoogloea sp.]|uniref:DegQ family serine endoprotease n=1 Tax=Zoogloea sp. TaxID=49181 RepID=UPI00261FAAA0|nr:DegQ family serine endoprotease [Zoogloea sp.]MDD2988607.1 DegQ family serine endoprotease [Zoogloea sp.]